MGAAVVHPRHYNAHPSGTECLRLVQHLSFHLGSAVKYLWRAGLKQSETEDIEKALFLLSDALLQPVPVWSRGRNDALEDITENVVFYGGWASGPILHIVQASTRREQYLLKTAINCLQHYLHHPQERINNGPRLPS